MRIWTAVIAGVIGFAAGVSAQTNDLPGIAVPDAAAREQMAAARRQFMESDRGKELRSAIEAADRECFNTAAEIPELKALDAQAMELARQMRELRMRRMEMEKTFPALVEKKAAAEKAHKDFRDAMMAVTRVEQAK